MAEDINIITKNISLTKMTSKDPPKFTTKKKKTTRTETIKEKTKSITQREKNSYAEKRLEKCLGPDDHKEGALKCKKLNDLHYLMSVALTFFIFIIIK